VRHSCHTRFADGRRGRRDQDEIGADTLFVGLIFSSGPARAEPRSGVSCCPRCLLVPTVAAFQCTNVGPHVVNYLLEAKLARDAGGRQG
jgi:hypothetical protein